MGMNERLNPLYTALLRWPKLDRQAQLPDHIRIPYERIDGAECNCQTLLDHPSRRMSSQIPVQVGANLDACSHGLLGAKRTVNSYTHETKISRREEKEHPGGIDEREILTPRSR
jgi:hypothetical protein